MLKSPINNHKEIYEILVCIDEPCLESRILSLCNYAGYSTNISCYNFLSGNPSNELSDNPLIITSSSTFQGHRKEEVIKSINSTVTQVLYIGELPDIPNSKSLWTLTENATDEEILHLIAKACEMHELAVDNARYRSVLRTSSNVHDFKVASASMKEVLDLVKRVAPLQGSILITGESGTGKSLLARYIHSISANKSGAFISHSCATFPRDLMESELFGSERGAFTGSVESRAGAVELADRGTLFLDEIGDLPLELQPKLLTFLQDKTTKRLGASKTKSVSVRVISATNLSLESMITEKRFRSDLFYRINTFHVHLRPLRERREDIPLLCDIILKRICEERKNLTPEMSKECLDVLMNYSWPGNVRELENVLEQATAYSLGSTISLEELEKTLESNNINISTISKNKSETLILEDHSSRTLEEIESLIIKDRLSQFADNKTKAAKSLGISLKTLYNKLSI